MKELVALLIFISVVLGQEDCDGKNPNTIPIITDPPVLVSSHTYGKLYTIKQIEPNLDVLHVYGSPYEMGLAHGTLVRSKIQKLVPAVFGWIEGQAEQFLPYLPKWLADFIAEFGVMAGLDATYYMTAPYIPDYFLEELRGLSHGSQVEYMDIIRIHMLPELIKAQCSMIGAWGDAIKDTNGTLYQLRALDWTTNGPFQQSPMVLVYHPEKGNNFTILGWTGFVGALTGFSSSPIGLSQKVWVKYNGTDSREGIPFHFLLRDILQWDLDTNSAIGRIASAHRTCSIFVGLGDGSNQFRAIEYSLDTVQVWDDKNFPAYKNHPLFSGLVYIDKHPQPSYHPCLGSLMQKYYGSLDAITIKQYVTALHQTGDLHIGIYDFRQRLMYVANASPYENGKYVAAYDRPFVRFDLNQLFAQKL